MLPPDILPPTNPHPQIDMKTFPHVCALLSVLTLGHASGQDSFNINLGGAYGAENISNTLVFSGGGVTATAKSWSTQRSSPTLQRSQLVQWSPGIGSKNSTETITNVPYVPYYVDNEDHYDLVLFRFDRTVDLSSVFLDPSNKEFDMDVTYWFGNVASDVSLTGKTLSGLSSLGFGNAIHDDTSPSKNVRRVSLTSPVNGVNALLIGARVGGGSVHDRFKIAAVHGTTVPEPGAVMLGGLAGITMLLRRRR